VRIGYAAAFYARGLVYRDLGKYREAIADFGPAIDQDPTNADAYLERGNAWYALHEFDRAIEDYTQAIQRRPDWSWPYHNRGNAWKANGDCEQAIRDYTVAIARDDRYALAYRNRAECYAMAGEPAKADADRVTAAVLESGLLGGNGVDLAPGEFLRIGGCPAAAPSAAFAVQQVEDQVRAIGQLRTEGQIILGGERPFGLPAMLLVDEQDFQQPARGQMRAIGQKARQVGRPGVRQP
jgi:tetratricopeptide (TPR) repeat protein